MKVLLVRLGDISQRAASIWITSCGIAGNTASWGTQSAIWIFDMDWIGGVPEAPRYYWWWHGNG